MANIKINFTISDDEKERIEKIIPVLNTFGSPNPDRCEDWTVESVVEFLIFNKTYGDISKELEQLEKSLEEE